MHGLHDLTSCAHQIIIVYDTFQYWFAVCAMYESKFSAMDHICIPTVGWAMDQEILSIYTIYLLVLFQY